MAPESLERAPRRMPVTAAGQRTRDALLDAGIAVAEKSGLSGLSVNAVVDVAGVAKGTFYVHFLDRDAFLDAMHERFYAEVAATVRAAVEHLPLGAERLAVGVDAYLDSCLVQRGVKPLLRDLHGGGCGPAATRSMAERETAFTSLTLANLRAMRCRDVAVLGRLLTAAISETAVLEMEAGRRLPAARRALTRWINAASAT